MARRLTLYLSLALMLELAVAGNTISAEEPAGGQDKDAQVSNWALDDYCADETPSQVATEGIWRLSSPYISTIQSELVAVLKPGKEGEGRVIQSIAFSPQHCALFATSSFGGKPETIGLWKFSNKENQGLITKKSIWGHSQDLSISVSGKDEYLWLPNNDGTGLINFQFNELAATSKVENVREHIVSQEPEVAHSVNVSRDGSYIVTASKKRKDKLNPYKISIFQKNNDIFESDEGKIFKKIGDKNFTLLKNFFVDSEQAEEKQHLQGLAIIGNTIFILTGNSNIKKDKLIYSYNFNGEILYKSKISTGIEYAKNDGKGKVYEPEGLDILYSESKIELLLGFASGSSDNKIYRLFKLPLLRD
jgi:hypothetical protein